MVEIKIYQDGEFVAEQHGDFCFTVAAENETSHLQTGLVGRTNARKASEVIASSVAKQLVQGFASKLRIASEIISIFMSDMTEHGAAEMALKFDQGGGAVIYGEKIHDRSTVGTLRRAA